MISVMLMMKTVEYMYVQHSVHNRVLHSCIVTRLLNIDSILTESRGQVFECQSKFAILEEIN